MHGLPRGLPHEGAIGEDPLKTGSADCIQCRECAGSARRRRSPFPPLFPGWANIPAPISPAGGFVYSVGGGLTLGFLSLRTPFTSLQGRRQLIRPPGALPETAFLRTCIRCGNA